jgi:alpha-beta hydrolase superfamily lysophospholipase
MAMHFARRGFAVHAYDQSGHGRSPGPRGDVDHFDRMLDELSAFIEFVSDQHANQPLCLVGHSMGGLVAASTCAFRSPAIDRLVLSGALLEIGPNNPAWKQVVARLLAPFGSWVGLAIGLDAEGLSRDPEVGRRYEADPYVKDRMTARFAAGMMNMIGRVRAAVAEIDCPVMILHGGADPMSPVSGSRALHARLSPSISSQSRLCIYPDLRHEIFQEPERGVVWQDMLDWIQDEEADSESRRAASDPCVAIAASAQASWQAKGVKHGG